MLANPCFNSSFKQVSLHGFAHLAANRDTQGSFTARDKPRDIEVCRPKLKIGVSELGVLSVRYDPPYHKLIRLRFFSLWLCGVPALYGRFW
jgi:hypothetical protein